MSLPGNSVRIIALAILVAIFSSIAAGVNGQDTTAPVTVTAKPDNRIETVRNQLTTSELGDEEKKPILDLLTKAETEFREAGSQKAAAATKRQAVQNILTRAADLKASLKNLIDFKPQPAANVDLPELEASLSRIDTELAKAKQAAADAESAMTQSSQRRRAMETDLPALEKQLDERKIQIETASASTDTGLAATAKAIELDASAALLQATIDAMRAELELIEAETTGGVLQLRRDVAVRQVETLQQQQKVIATAVENARVRDAEARVQAAASQLATLHPALTPIGEQNTQLAQTNKDLATKIDEANKLLTVRKLRLEEITEAYRQSKNRVQTVGLSDAVGAMLRAMKQSLPSVSAYRLRARERQPEINEAQFTLIELTDQRNTKLDIAVAALLRESKLSVAMADRAELEVEARRLMEQQRTEFLDPAINSQRAYFNALVSLSTTEQQIIQLVNEATLYANERILWIRSSRPLYEQLRPADDEWWFLLPAAWINVPVKLAEEFGRNMLTWFLGFLVFLIMVKARLGLRRELVNLGRQANQKTCTDFLLTLKALCYSVLIAAPVPIFFGFVAWRLRLIAGNDPATVALTQASTAVAAGYFPIEVLRQVCRPHGLAECHFSWSAPVVHRLRQGLRWLLFSTMPMLLVTSFLNASGASFGSDTLERYFYLGAVVMLTVFTARMLHPRTGLPANHLKLHPTGWGSRTSFVWFPVAIAIPVSLVGLAVVGYYFTSQQLAWRMFYSVCLLMTIMLAVSIVLRWVSVNRRRLKIEQSRRRRDAAAQTDKADIMLAVQEETPEVLQIQMQQTRRMLNTVVLATLLGGMWVIWDDVLPALGFMENWPLWMSTTTVTEILPNAAGVVSTTTRDIPDPVTFADLLLGMLILLVTFLATRNLPGLLEFSLLRRLPLDNSVRYATTTLASYAIVLLGSVMAGQAIGLHWNQIQWMATALTFGLAFGLQEMFANFIAGIIILFEQPVRVGDVVEIDGVTGVVSKIRIRATTITNWDNMDYIVPNKEFITGKLLNWTRSDEITRLVINVGIAYGSDTVKAREILEAVANENPDVLKEPPSQAFFLNFGDNSLNFSLRVFINNYERRNYIAHDLLMEIDKAFRGAAIEISFPQRDLHLRSMPQAMVDAFRRDTQVKGDSDDTTST